MSNSQDTKLPFKRIRFLKLLCKKGKKKVNTISKEYLNTPIRPTDQISSHEPFIKSKNIIYWGD